MLIPPDDDAHKLTNWRAFQRKRSFRRQVSRSRCRSIGPRQPKARRLTSARSADCLWRQAPDGGALTDLAVI